MKILILTNNDVGLYKFRKELLETLLVNHEVFISLPKGSYIEKLESMGCKYIHTEVDRRGTKPTKDIVLFLSYLRILKTLKPDIVLTYTIKPNVYGGLACRITKTEYLANITGLGTAIENGGLLQKVTMGLYKVGLGTAKSVFFQNESNKNFFEKNKIVKGNTHILPGSGVNVNLHALEKYPNDEIIRFLFIGRVMKAKGINELLEAAKLIKKKKSNVEFNIVGTCEESYLGILKELEELGVVRYYGHQDDVHPFIKKAHAVVLPSYHEGMANVLLEAASSGRPVIASNIPGCSETFDEGVSGLGFQVRNVDSLVETLTRFIDLPYLQRKEMGLFGRKKVEREFDRKIVVRAYMEEIIGEEETVNGFVRKNS